MNSTDFVSELHKRSEDKASMAHFRRLFTSNQLKGLSILAGIGIPVSDKVETLPYLAVAYAFAQHGSGTASCNFGRSLSLGVPAGGDSGRPFDKRFDALVACRSTDILVRTHLIRAVQQLDKDQGINYPLLLEDLKGWNSSVVNRWIEGYYTP